MPMTTFIARYLEGHENIRLLFGELRKDTQARRAGRSRFQDVVLWPGHALRDCSMGEQHRRDDPLAHLRV